MRAPLVTPGSHPGLETNKKLAYNLTLLHAVAGRAHGKVVTLGRRWRAVEPKLVEEKLEEKCLKDRKGGIGRSLKGLQKAFQRT